MQGKTKKGKELCYNTTVTGLIGAPIAILPEKLSVDGDLDLSFTEITALPDGLRVGGRLILSHTSVRTLPEQLRIGGEIICPDVDPRQQE